MARPGICPQCDRPLPSDAPHGICPQCMFGLGMEPDEQAHGQATGSAGGHHRLFTPPTPAELAPHFPQLEILEIIGQGGMGAVYRARQKMLDRVVALKVLPFQVGIDPAFEERFTREARALARLTHPQIVMIFDFGQADQYYYFLMEYVDGINLRQAIGEPNRLTPEQALAIVPQVCEALQYAHDQGIVHRDIKPENVLLDKQGNVKIADFGLAKLLGQEKNHLHLTGTQQVMGTPHYMAPEQMEKPQSVDHRADIYSLGVVFYELLTGELPLGRFAPPSQKADINARLDDVVLRSLEKEPAQRYQHASDVKTAVEAAAVPPQQKSDKPPVTRSHRIHRVPFSIRQIYGGLAKAKGILRFDGKTVSMEFEVKDDVLGVIRSGVRNVDFPLEELVDVRLNSAWLQGPEIILRTDRLDAVQGVPSSEHGRVRLRVAREDAETAEQVVDAMCLAISEQTPGAMHSPASDPDRPRSERPYSGSRHDRPVTEEMIRRVERDLRIPANGLLGVGIALFLLPLFAFPLLFLSSATIGTRHQQSIALPSVGFEDSEDSATMKMSSGPMADPSMAAEDDSESEMVVIGDVAISTHSDETPQQAFSLYTASWIGFGLIWLMLTVWCFAIAGLFVVGAARMRQIESFGFSLFVGVLAVVPLHPLFLFSLPFGIWALTILVRRGTAGVFRQQHGRQGLHGSDALGASPPQPNAYAPVKPAAVDQGAMGDPLRVPGIGLVLVAVLNIAAWFLACIAVVKLSPLPIWLLVPAVIPLLVSLVILKGALNMLRGQSYGMANVGAVAAILPLNLFAVLSIPLGIWALIQLQKPNVRSRFRGQWRWGLGRESSDAAGRERGGTGATGVLVAAAILLVTLGVCAVAASVAYLSLAREASPARSAPFIHTLESLPTELQTPPAQPASESHAPVPTAPAPDRPATAEDPKQNVR